MNPRQAENMWNYLSSNEIDDLSGKEALFRHFNVLRATKDKTVFFLRELADNLDKEPNEIEEE